MEDLQKGFNDDDDDVDASPVVIAGSGQSPGICRLGNPQSFFRGNFEVFLRGFFRVS